MTTTYRVATPEDLPRIEALSTLAFNYPWTPEMRARVRIDEYRVLDDAGTIPAALKINDVGHVFGGSAVRAGGIGAVAVAAEARGRGHGTTIMREALRELRAGGVPLSSLYPATIPVYRACGYGHGMHWTRWKTPLSALPTRAPLDAEPFETAAEIAPAYARIARAHAGLLVRDARWWEQRVLTEENRHRYLVRESGRVTGWIIYALGTSEEGWRFPLHAHDLYWETPEAARALLALAAMHRSTASDLSWIGPLDEPLVSFLDDHGPKLVSTFRGMLRLVDVPAALEARGYPSSADARITIAVEDAVLPENAGPWSVHVTDGVAKVVAAPGARADAIADAGTWASLYAGMHAARDAARLGRLRADDPTIATLEAMFAGPTPWLGDFF